ncbi:MAG TPA: hypothetical protein PL033_15125 [Candidatus Brocadiia bacterium]|nr:hypothetical protein [Candidatus Brocadiia bacterium]
MKTHSLEAIDEKQTSRHSGVTLRSFIIGILCVIFVTAYTPYNDYVLGNTFFVGNHLPIGVIFIITLLVLFVNSLLKRLAEGAHFSPSELIVILSMMLASAAFPSSGLHRYWANTLAMPFYIADSSKPAWAEVMARLDPRLFPTTDPNSKLVDDFMRGKVNFFLQSEYWLPWARAMSVWALFLVPLFLAFVCVCAIARDQWIHNESLTFPLAQFTLELVKEPEPGLCFNEFFRNRLTWLGMSLPVVLFTLFGLKLYYPSVPAVKLDWWLLGIFQEFPWNAMDWALYNGRLYLSAAAIAMIIPTDIAFSLWFFFVAVAVSDGLLLLAGVKVPIEAHVAQEMGGYVMLMGMLMYVGRNHFLRAGRSAIRILRGVSGDESREQGIAFAGLLACCLICWLWLWHFRMGPVWSLFLIGLMMVMNVVLGRAVAEAGMMFIQPRWWLIHGVLSLIGIRTVGVAPAMVIALVTLIVGHDLRECLLPYLLNGSRMAEASGRIQRGRFAGAIIASILVSVFLGAMVHLGIDYYWGPLRHDPWGMAMAFDQFIGSVASDARQSPPVARNAFHFAGGAAFVGLLSLMRSRLTWWPFHPMGFIMATTYPGKVMWPSVFLGWFLKLVVMRYGGSSVYYRLKPLIYGVILGECLMGGIWMFATAVMFWLGKEPQRVILLPL